ncbi:hypothetical protein [Corynebacterium belfantii]|uniref:hypothetical protein n=1 Tax=Corynebacterium belfantii TaxID=2014537 RepID=UPI000B4AF20F|nr:hypothetical protein [Corynebacterium belfantii]OWM36296.1 hypothetical protein AZF07_10750 [Corynebacterium diphtheriae subsp. lausannense]MBG9258742.1 hypothetical protein [Corynebacterium belfantii]MBG9265444.1 hypothetical protein [Corynebacterium belfantii]MBG9287603.1 hypothetical protein [Corynebacterium belfantii]MBG9298175.1 hypothetical protein [Corynebacterium belfantii]
MRAPHRQGHTRWTKLPLVFAVGTLSAAMLAACGSDTATDTTDGSAGPSSPATATATPTTADALSVRIVGAEDAPEGLTHEDFYAIAPKELPIEGADTVVAVDQNLQGLTLDDADMSGARAGERTTVVIAQAHGHTITAVGTGDIPDRAITDLVNKQIRKLAS